jgi:hypothetical protein
MDGQVLREHAPHNFHPRHEEAFPGFSMQIRKLRLLSEEYRTHLNSGLLDSPTCIFNQNTALIQNAKWVLVESRVAFFFWQYWGLNSGPHNPLLFLGYFSDRVSTSCSGWPQTTILLPVPPT